MCIRDRVADGRAMDTGAKRKRNEPAAETIQRETKRKERPNAKKRKINPRVEIHYERLGLHSNKMLTRKCLEDAYARATDAEEQDSVRAELTRSFRYIMKIVRNPQEDNPEESSYSSDLD